MDRTEAQRPLVIRMAGLDDLDVLRQVASGVFGADPNPAYCREFLEDPRHHLAIALEAERLVGFASGVHYVHPDKPCELWINEVGVTPSHQRRGIARKLLETLFAHARELGCREAWLATERDNTAARGLYSATGGTEQPMVYVTFDLDPRDD